MIVLKFGGSSVACATNMSRVLDILEDAAVKDRIILVSSAISGCTDKLIGMSGKPDRTADIKELKTAHDEIVSRLFSGEEGKKVQNRLETLFKELESAPSDCCQTFGELFSTTILAAKLADEGYRVKWLDSRDLVRLKAGVLDRDVTYSNIAEALDEETEIFVVPGFIASDGNGRPVDLGRGGSDYSAAIYAAASGSSEVIIWTDVPGIMTCNPKDVPGARTVPALSYEAAFELSSSGAKVLYPPTVVPAREMNIPINIRNTFEPSNPGTVIGNGKGTAGKWIAVASSKQDDKSLITLVGEEGCDKNDAVRRILRSLSDAGLAVSGEPEKNGLGIVVPVRPAIEKQALRSIHREFFEERKLSTIDIYIAGTGAVGTALVKLIGESGERVAERTGRSIRICGFSSSRTFIDEVLAKAGRGSVFVDCTDSLELHSRFCELFRRGIGVVTSNRRSLAVPYPEYREMKRTAMENGVPFLYDTTVGTALPVLESIAGSANCTDEITGIDAVISCTINHLVTAHLTEGGGSMAQLLREAQGKGLTEPDPRVDLGGGDVLRKLLILAREAGVPLEEEDVKITPMLGAEFFGCPLEEFYSKLEAAEDDLRAREKELSARGLRQRFVASLKKTGEGYSASIKMQEVDSENPFYRVSGTENIIRIEIGRGAPLIIRGAGEGASQAASGVLNDILK